MKSLYDKIGGKAVIEAATDEFYDRVLADPLLKLHFEDTDISLKKASFRQYISYLLGGTKTYGGSTIYEAHKGREITDLGFDTFVELFADSLRELKVSDDHIGQIKERLLPLKNEVVDSFAWSGKHFYAAD